MVLIEAKLLKISPEVLLEHEFGKMKGGRIHSQILFVN